MATLPGLPDLEDAEPSTLPIDPDEGSVLADVPADTEPERAVNPGDSSPKA